MITHMLPEDMQRSNEYLYCRKHINTYLDQAIRQDPDSEAKVVRGIQLLSDWLEGQYHLSKMARLAQLDALHLEQMVRDIFIGICYCQTPELFVSVTAQLASKVGFDDHRDSILTMAEMVAVLCETDAFDIIKGNQEDSLLIQCNLKLPHELMDAITRSVYVPPMVCEPKEVTNNFESPYLTFNDCQILGRGNAHTGDICLDVINLQNSIPLKLAVDFLSTVEEEPSAELDSLEKKREWAEFKRQSYALYTHLVQQGNKIYLTHKVDKRGRLYAQGYHINSQGSAFKKAMLELHQEEIVNGIRPNP
jgi:hypothetical protein